MLFLPLGHKFFESRVYVCFVFVKLWLMIGVLESGAPQMVDEVNSNIQLISRFEYNKISKNDNSHSWGSLEFIFFLGLEVPQTCLLLTPRCSLNLHFPSFKMMRKHFSLARNGKSKHRFECSVILPVCFAGHKGTHGTYKTS